MKMELENFLFTSLEQPCTRMTKVFSICRFYIALLFLPVNLFWTKTKVFDVAELSKENFYVVNAESNMSHRKYVSLFCIPMFQNILAVF